MQSIIKKIIEDERKERDTSQGKISRNYVYKQNNADLELEEILNRSSARIKCAGIGGAGNNAISRLFEMGIEGVTTFAVNTDAKDLLYTSADEKFLIGKRLTGGLGAGNNPEIGQAAALESADEIRDLLNVDMLFVTCGLGGGTGTGASHVLAEIAKDSGALIVTICTLPFQVEGLRKKKNAVWGLERLSQVSDTIIVIPNEKLLDIAPDLSLAESFAVVDEILIRGVKGVTELITRPGLVNVDFADVRTTLLDSGEALIGLGESQNPEEAALNALNNPLLDLDIYNARGALINVMGNCNMSLQDTKTVINTITEELNPETEIIWGALIDPELKNSIRVTTLISGIKSNNLFEPAHEKSTKNQDFDLGLPKFG
ncbi:MAG: cell division protein FtsZ [Candidatus Helarchaeota archaeon]|nr:cell division protein FtsZ [Candidatus Helarchaeota archaeon]